MATEKANDGHRQSVLEDIPDFADRGNVFLLAYQNSWKTFCPYGSTCELSQGIPALTETILWFIGLLTEAPRNFQKLREARKCVRGYPGLQTWILHMQK